MSRGYRWEDEKDDSQNDYAIQYPFFQLSPNIFLRSEQKVAMCARAAQPPSSPTTLHLQACIGRPIFESFAEKYLADKNIFDWWQDRDKRCSAIIREVRLAKMSKTPVITK